MIQNIAVTFSFEIEVGVLSEIDRGGFVRGCVVFDGERVAFRQPVDDRDVEIAGIAFFLIPSLITEFNLVFAGFVMSSPDDFIEPEITAVQMVGPVVGRQ